MNIKQAVLPLRLIFIGGILCVLDFTFLSSRSINGQLQFGFRFDVLSDFLGMILVTAGVVKLAKFQVDSSYRKQMQFVFICCLIGCVEAFFGHFIFPYSRVLSLLGTCTNIATLIAVILFATSMAKLATAHGLYESASSWLVTRILMIVFWCVPMGLLNALAFGSLVEGRPSLNIGILIIPVLLLRLIPLVHHFISTTKMLREAKSIEVSVLAKKL